MSVSLEVVEILKMGELVHYIYRDGANNKRHVVMFVALVSGVAEVCGINVLALTLGEYRKAKYTTEVLPKDTDKLSIGEVKITGETTESLILNDGSLETIRLSNSRTHKAMDRGTKLLEGINDVFARDPKGTIDNHFIVKYYGYTAHDARRVMHISPSTPRFKLVHYPENSHIGLYDSSLNSPTAFPRAVVVLAQGKTMEEVIGKLTGVVKEKRSWCCIFMDWLFG